VDTIEASGIRAFGCHGVLPEEQARAQPFEVDLRLEVDLAAAAASDRLEDTVDYGSLTVAVTRIVEDESYRLLERLADRIAGLCLSRSGVRSVEVSVRKLRPPVPVQVASVGVTIHRQAVHPDLQRGPARRAHLGLGSNLGDRLGFLQGAITGLASTPGIEVVAVSRVYETAPVGGPHQGPYLNAVVAVDTDLGATELLDVAQRLEAAAGRIRAERWGPRSLDVDVLLIGDERITTDRLTVPHPRLFERGFVLAPLADVAPSLVERPDGGWDGVEATGLALDPSRPGFCYEPPP